MSQSVAACPDEVASELRVFLEFDKMVRSGSDDPVSASQTDISRTPSTSTTGSSHTSSLDTTISSVISTNGSSSTRFPDQSADTLKFIVDKNFQAVISKKSDDSPLSFASAPDVLLTKEPGLLVDTEADKTVQAKIRRYAALLELIETERNYADDLANLVLVFFDNLCTMPFFDDQPARQALIMRNSEDLLRLHQKLSACLEAIMIGLRLRKPSDPYLSDDKRQSDYDKALSPEADEAVIRVAKLFKTMMPGLQSYKAFCSRHSEALMLIKEAEKRHADWDAYERRCADIIRMSTTPSHYANIPASYFTPISAAAAAATATSSSDQTSAAVTPGSVHSTIRQNSSRLLFRDFLIKPIQRLCLYPLVLQTLLKHSPQNATGSEELSQAITLMRQVADQVDKAGKQRELELMAHLIASRVELHHGVTTSFLSSLGDCWLAGALDVLHHHRVTAPLVAPLRFKYSGVFLYQSFILFVKVRKNHTYECRQWFPLWAAKLSHVEGESSLLPHSFRLSVKHHHFEVAAANARERQVWIDALSTAISTASITPPGSEAAFPSNLSLADVLHTPDHFDRSEGTTPSAARYTEANSYFSVGKDRAGVDPLMEFFTSGVLQTTASAQKGQRSSSDAWVPTKILLRHASPSTRSTVDRGMVFSESIMNARTSKDAGHLSSLWLPSGPSIGSTVGTAMGISRLSARDTSTVKIQRRKSCAGLLENRESGSADDNQLLFTATLMQPQSRFRASTRLQCEAMGDRDTWKASLRKKAAKVRPSSIFAPTDLSVMTDNLSSLKSLHASSSTPTSPVYTTRELPIFEAQAMMLPNVSAPVSPTIMTQRLGLDDFSHSLVSSPPLRSGSGLHSASASTVNLGSGLTGARRRSSMYGMKESLAASFGHRSRTRSTQTDMTDFSSEAAATSSRGISPMTSSAALNVDGALDITKAELGGRFGTSSRTSSRPGSLRRAFTSASFASRKRAQSDVTALAELKAGNALNRQATIDMVPALPTSPLNGLAAENTTGRWRRGSIKSYGTEKSLGNSLRRSKTMFGAGRSWFASSSPSISVEKVNAEGVPSPTRSAEAPEASALTSSSSSSRPSRQLRSNTEPDMSSSRLSRASVKNRSESMPYLPQTSLPTTTNISPKRGSRMFNSLRFLQSNRLSPLPLKAVAETSVEHSNTSPVSAGRMKRSSLPDF